MRTVFVIPGHVDFELVSELIYVERNEQMVCELRFEGKNKPFNNGDAPILADGAVAELDSFALCPFTKSGTVEVRVSPIITVLTRGRDDGKVWAWQGNQELSMLGRCIT